MPIIPAEFIAAPSQQGKDGVELVAADAVKQRLSATLRDLKLPPRKTSAILASVNLPASKRRDSPYGGKSAVEPPKPATRRRKSDYSTAASKPVLVLGR